MKSLFTDPKAQLYLKSVILEAGDTLDPDQRQRFFEASGVDSEDGARRALETLSEKYSNPPTHDEAVRKILALHFLSLTRFLDPTATEATLAHLDTMLSQTIHPRTHAAIILDFHELVRTLSRTSPGSLTVLFQSLSSPELKRFLAQIERKVVDS